MDSSTRDIPAVRGQPSGAGPSVSRFLLIAGGPITLVLVMFLPGVPPELRTAGLSLVYLFVPGFLAWSIFARSPHFREAFAVPALAFAASVTLNLPAVFTTMLFHWDFTIALVVITAQMVVLGTLAARWGNFYTTWPRGSVRWIIPIVVVTGAIAVSLVALYWTSDDSTYRSFIETVRSTGRFPAVNPYLSGDLPLSPRWRISGWVGLLGGFAYWGGASSAILLERVLPPLIMVGAISAAYALARAITHRMSLSIATAIAAALLPLLDDPLQNPSLYTPWYRGITQDKYVMALIMLPVAMMLLVSLAKRPALSRVGAAAAVMLAATFVHPLALPLIATLLTGYLFMRLIQKRGFPVRSLLAVTAAFVPTVLAGLVIVLTFNTSFGVSGVPLASEQETEIREYGPFSVLEISEIGRLTSVDSNDPAATESYFRTAHVVLGLKTRLVLTSGGGFVGSPTSLLNPLYVFVALASVLLLVYERRSMLTAWVIGTMAVVVSVHVWPLAAQTVSLVVPPWQLWRLTWFAPVAFAVAWLVVEWPRHVKHRRVGYLVVTMLLVWAVLIMPHDGFLRSRSSKAAIARGNSLRVMESVTDLDGIFFASRGISNAVGIVPGINVVAARGRSSMSNNFPSSRQTEALARMQDQSVFFLPRSRGEKRREILTRWDIDYVIVTPELIDDDSLPLVAVRDVGRGLVLYRVERSSSGIP